MSGSYDQGDKVRLSCAFTNDGTTPTDPTALTLKVKTPDGVTATYTYAGGDITKDSSGNFHKDVSASQYGHWYYRWEATGAVEQATEGEFWVAKPTVP